MIPAGLLSDFRAALNTVADTAMKQVQENYLLAVANGLSPDELTDVMIDAALKSVSDFGDVASTVAAEFYEQVREMQQVGDPFLVELVDQVAEDHVRAAGYRGSRFLYDRKGTQGRVYAPDPAMYLREMSAFVEQQIMRAARQTVLDSAEVDTVKPRVTLVAKAGACKFCVNAMAEGWSWPEGSIESRPHIFHEHCRCVIVPSWDDMPRLEQVEVLPVEE